MMQTRFVAVPRVVVVMSAYNNAQTLSACLGSLTAQTMTEWVLLVADDGSKDGTPGLLEREAAGDSRIIPVFHADNQGMGARLNALIARALAEYPRSLIARMDADDICAPLRFEKQMNFLEENPEVGVVASWGQCLASDGSLVKETVETATLHDQIAVNSFFSAPLLHPSVMMRPEILQDLGSVVYDPALRRAQDFDLWARLVHRTRFAVLPEYLLLYRLGSDNRINKETDLNVFRRMIVDRNLERLGLGGKDARWKASAYALVGFPLPKTPIYMDELRTASLEFVKANELLSVYDQKLFTQKLASKYIKALRRARWWPRNIWAPRAWVSLLELVFMRHKS